MVEGYEPLDLWKRSNIRSLNCNLMICEYLPVPFAILRQLLTTMHPAGEVFFDQKIKGNYTFYRCRESIQVATGSKKPRFFPGWVPSLQGCVNTWSPFTCRCSVIVGRKSSDISISIVGEESPRRRETRARFGSGPRRADRSSGGG